MNDPRIDALRDLLDTVDTLRAPGGCPWDRKQTVASMSPMILEEAFEVADAISSQSDDDVAEELGDLLMNIALTSRIAEESGSFHIGDVATRIRDKLIRRHPHVFGDVDTDDVGEILANWESIKREEKRAKGKDTENTSVLSGIPRALPALLLSLRMGEKAARTGFDWPDHHGPFDKVREEIEELKNAVEAGDQAAREQELGDLLFAVVNVARHLGVDPESALRQTCDRFARRFRHVESALGDQLENAPLETMESYWEEAKRSETDGPT